MDALAGTVALLRVTEVALAVAVIDPPQVVAALGGDARRSCPPPADAVGKLSLIETLLSAFADALSSVILMGVTVFSEIKGEG